MVEQAKAWVGLSEDQINQIIFRLAHFNPSCQDEYGNQAIDYLVLDSLATFGPLLKVTAYQLKENIKKVFRLDFEEAEINAAGERLKKKNMINHTEDKRTAQSSFQLLPEFEQKINRNLLEIKELETEVLGTWKQSILEKYKDYPPIKNNIEALLRNLKLFTSKMFIRHGVECVALLYPEVEKIQNWLKNIENTITGDLPKIDPFTDEIAKLEIPNFFKSSDSKRRLYITNQFNSSFFWHLIQVDEKCSNLLREVTRGQKLFLDNNILYSLVGLDGGNMLRSVYSMLKLAKSLGYELAISTKTIDEFHNSLNWRMKELQKSSPIPVELAKIALEYLGDDSFLTCYWKDFVKNRISIEEFVTERSHLKDILENFEIEETHKWRKEIEGTEELLEEESKLRSILRVEVDERIIEHDAFHRVLIGKIRKGPKYRFSEAIAWFLTHDTKLPAYDRVARGGKEYLSFCILSDQWIQVNRPLLARTKNQEEYEEAFHNLVTFPYLRTMMPAVPLERAYQEVLGKLSRYKNMSPQLALNIVADRHFMVSFASESDELIKEEKIESKFVDLVNQFEKDKYQLEKDKAVLLKFKNDLSQSNIAMEERMKAQELKLKLVEKRLEETSSQDQIRINELQESLKKEKEDKELAKKEVVDISKELKAYKKGTVSWLIFAIGVFLLSIMLWGHGLLLNWPWLEQHKNKTIIEIATQFLLIFVFLNIPLKQHWKIWLTFIMSAVFAILGFACFR